MSQFRKVLFIVGYPRSGTTLLGRIVGSCSNSIFVGEVSRILERFTNGQPFQCECGLRSDECSFWINVQSNFFQKVENSEHGQNAIKIFFETIFEITQSEILIDSSKDKNYLKAVKKLTKINKYFVIVLRPIEGIVYSRKRDRILRIEQKRHPSPFLGKLHLLLLIKDYLNWKSYQRFAKKLFGTSKMNSVFILYNELVKSPRECIKKISRLVEKDFDISFQNEYEVNLKSGHVGISNRNRLINGVVKIADDQKWRKGLNIVEKGILKLLP